MSRLDVPPRVTVKPGVNIYTGLTVLSFLAMGTALGWSLYQYGLLTGWW